MTVRRSAAVAAMCTLGLLAATPMARSEVAAPGATGTLRLGSAECALIPKAPAGSDVLETCPGVRPGAIVSSDEGTCTMNFLFEAYRLNAQNEKVKAGKYIGTAGHCIIADGEQTWKAGEGPEARDADDKRIGQFAYAILEAPKDFALIRLDASVDPKPAMCVFGGPTGVSTSTSTEPIVLEHFGNGIGIGSVVPARQSTAVLGMPDPDHVYAQGVVTPGDSGSGVITSTGHAVGVAVTMGFNIGIGASNEVGTVGITRLKPQVDRAEKELNLVELKLLTAPKAS